MLINNQPFKAVMRPLAGTGAGAFVCEGTQVGSHAGDVAVRAVPRLRRTSVTAASAASAPVGAGNQPASRIQFKLTTQIDPVAPGGLGSHPVREPEPV